MHLDKEETLRYLGYRGNKPDEKVNELLGECAEEVESFDTVRYVCRRFDDIRIYGETGSVELGGISFKSRDLAAHLQDCYAAFVLCATLGAAADMARLRYEKYDMTKAVIMDAAQSAYIEQVCDKACDELYLNLCGSEENFELTSRYSPGYGDFPLKYQPIVLHMADAFKRIGLTASDTNMLTPQKSVTAIIGIRKIRRQVDEQHAAGASKPGETGTCNTVLKNCSACPMNKKCKFSK